LVKDNILASEAVEYWTLKTKYTPQKSLFRDVRKLL